MNLSTRDIARLVNGQHYGAETVVQAVNTDSRHPSSQSLFIAIKGERFDAHDFVAQASANGAVAALVERAVDADITQIVVSDARIAMAQLARHWRLLQPAFVVGLTGSCGKTTVKEMLASIFRQAGPTLATQGNLNNDLGVPMTLFRLEAHHRYAVIEMGANHIGEIAFCADIAKPQVSLITLVAPAHLEGFGCIDGVAKTKCEIYQALPIDGIAVINADDDYAAFFHQQCGNRQRLTFGIQKNADVSAHEISLNENGCARFVVQTPKGTASVQLPVPGQHNVMNALSAVATALASGLSLEQIVAGLQQTPTVSGRLNLLRSPNGLRVIDDTYNANLASMTAALDYLATFSGKKIAVLGHMGELGEDAEAMHQQLGQRARQRGVDRLLCIGDLSRATASGFGQGAQHFNDIDTLIATLTTLLENKTRLDNDTTVLVKGSRSARMERVVQALVPDNKNKEGAH